MRVLRQIILHQTGTATGTLESIRRYHTEVLGWRDIGYNYLLTRDAKVHKGRPNSEAGAHCQGDNADSIGICCVGEGDAFPLDTGYMTLGMFVELLKLIRTLRQAYPTITEISGHREKPSGNAQGKTCPGFDAQIIRRLVQGG